MKRMVLTLTILAFTAPVLASLNSVKGTQQDLVKELLNDYASCTKAGEPNVGDPGYKSDKRVVVYVCKRAGSGLLGGVDTLIYEEASITENISTTIWTKLN